MRGLRTWLSVLPVACLAAWALPAGADVIHLKDGKIEGKIIARKDGRVTIRTTRGIITYKDAKEIVAVEERVTPREVYASMAAKIKPSDPEAHYALAMWCKTHDLQDEMKAELVATLRADPNHERAKADLGYVKTPDGWMTRAEAMRAKGMVLHNGRWMTAEDAEKQKIREKQKKLLLAINAVVAKIRISSKARQQKYEHLLADFDDSSMAWRIGQLLKDPHPVIRRAACSALANMRCRDAAPALTRYAMLDKSESVRRAALDAALRLDMDTASGALYKMIADRKLKPINNRAEQRSVRRLYRRITLALGEISDVRSVPFLIEILYPKIAITGAAGPPHGTGSVMGIQRASGGPTALDIVSGGVITGVGEAEPVPGEPDRYFFNQDAEDLLEKLTGQELGVRPRDWRRWWKKHGIELVRKQEAERRGGRDKVKQLLKEAAGEPKPEPR